MLYSRVSWSALVLAPADAGFYAFLIRKMDKMWYSISGSGFQEWIEKTGMVFGTHSLD